MPGPEFTPEEDDLLESRTLSDAELIKGGAEYENGILDPTLAQKEQIEKDYLKSKIRPIKKRIIIQGHGRSETEGTISGVKQIAEQSAHVFKDREEIADYVEKPLLLAAEILYDKNIRTTASTANLVSSTEENGLASLAIDYETLSDENREIARKLGLKKYGNTVQIDITINLQTKVADISRQAEAIANSFVLQEPSWIPRLTLDNLKETYGAGPADDWTPEMFEDQFYYDKESGIFYYSEEHFRKVKDWENRTEKN